MEHARATFVYGCAHESLKYTLGYKNTVQLSVYVSIVSWKFFNKFEKTKETDFKTNVASWKFPQGREMQSGLQIFLNIISIV